MFKDVAVADSEMFESQPSQGIANVPSSDLLGLKHKPS